MAVPSTAVIRHELGTTFNEFDERMNRKKFIGPKALRPRVVAVQAANVGKLPLEVLLNTPDDNRSPGGGYKRGDFEIQTFSYATNEHGWEEPMDDSQLAIYRDILDAEAIHARRAEDIVMRNFEIACAATLYDTAVWTGASLTTAITNEWDDWTNATALVDVEAARQKVIDGTGLTPNAMIMNRKQAFNLKNQDKVVDRLKFAGFDDPKDITLRSLAVLLELDFILVADGFDNTADEGQAASLSSIWSDEYMMVARIAVTDDPQEACVARAFLWDGDGPGAPGSDEEFAVIVEEYREESVRGSVIRARNNRDIVVMYAQAAHLLSNAITI